MREFVEFLRRLWRVWATLLTGGTGIALLLLWERHNGAAVSPRIFWTLAFLLLVLSGFLVWRDEWRKRVEIEAVLGAKVAPQLESTIDWVHLARDPRAQGDSQIIVIASITNTGPQVVLTNGSSPSSFRTEKSSKERCARCQRISLFNFPASPVNLT